MGNINCTPNDCVNMRPGQAATDCFRAQNSRDNQGRLKVSSGTPQELFEEWTQLTQQVANSFSEDPESNLYIIRLSKPLLARIFKESKQRAVTTKSHRSGSTYAMKSTTTRDSILDQISIKELLAHINAHTTYPSAFLPMTVQAEPSDSIEGNPQFQGKKFQTLPQLKAKYEFELMHSLAVLYLVDTSAMRRFDFKMPEQLRFSSFTLEKAQVAPGISIELKASQLLNQIREQFYLHNKIVVGGLQLIENEYQLMFAQGCAEERTPRQQNWPEMLSGELIHSLSLLPGLMQRQSYKDSHTLQCIIRMQAYTYASAPRKQGQTSGSTPTGSPSFSKQVQFLVIFKQSLFLPKGIDYLLQLQKDVTWQGTKVNEKQVCNMVFNLSPKSFLFIMSQRKLKHGTRHHKAQVAEMAENLKQQEKAYRREARRNQKDSAAGTDVATAAEESKESKEGLDFSTSAIAVNHSHTIDQLMFRSHETGGSGRDGGASQRQSRVISMLAEDVKSFSKVNSENLVDQLAITEDQSQLVKRQQTEVAVAQQRIVEIKAPALIQLEKLMNDDLRAMDDASEESKEPIERSHLAKHGNLQGDYLVDFSKSKAAVKSGRRRQPVILQVDTSTKIGKIKGVGYVHYDTELLSTDQVTVKKVNSKTLKQTLAEVEELAIGDPSQLKYVGEEGHWKVFYLERSLTKFIYHSTRTQFVYNCLYEAQFYKRWINGTDLFGKEIIFKSKSGGEPTGVAVQVERPGVFLDDFVFRLWQTRSARCQEAHTDLKVFYILFQVLSQVKTKVIDAGISHNLIRLRSFHIHRPNWKIKITNFAFAARKPTASDQAKKGQRGCISGTQTDQEALLALIEDLASLSGNSGDLKIKLCSFTDEVEKDYSNGVEKVIELTKKYLIENLSELIRTFSLEEKLEGAFDYLLEQLGQNPMLLSPFSWVSMKTRNSLSDLRKASVQSRDAVSRRIVYESATTKDQIFTFLSEIQDRINGAFQTIKPGAIQETRHDDPIVMDFDQLKDLRLQDSEKEPIEDLASIGIILLYTYVEKMVNHGTGDIQEAQETLFKLQELFNYDYGCVHYHLIKVMMADVRLQQQVPLLGNLETDQAESGEKSETKESPTTAEKRAPLMTEISAEYNDFSSKAGLAKVLLLKDFRVDQAAEILDDLYMYDHPLAKLFSSADGRLDSESEAMITDRYLPWYFKQRLALLQPQNVTYPMERLGSVIISKLSGVSSAKMSNYDHVYLIFYNMQRLLLLFIYHELVLPDEIFPSADLSQFCLSNSGSGASLVKQAMPPRNGAVNSAFSKRMLHSSSSQETTSTGSKKRKDPALYLQLQRFFKRLFHTSLELQQSCQSAFTEFFEAVLYVQVTDVGQEHWSKLFEVFCTPPPPSSTASASQAIKSCTGSEESTLWQNQSKFWRLERVLQLMRSRLSSFDGQLVLDQHDKFWRREYYTAAYQNQPISRYSDETDSMEPENLSKEFLEYAAMILQLSAVEEAHIELFDGAKQNFLRCPCCPAAAY